MKEQGMKQPEELRFVTYLSLGIPQAFFEAVVEHVRRALGRRASLSVETRVSGPMKGGDDPFSKGEVEIGFMCAPVTYEHHTPEQQALRRCESVWRKLPR